MNADQHNQLMLLRRNLTQAVLANDADRTQRSLGMVQGFLLGLHAADEIEFADMQALEDDVTQGLSFLVNARKVSHAH